MLQEVVCNQDLDPVTYKGAQNRHLNHDTEMLNSIQYQTSINLCYVAVIDQTKDNVEGQCFQNHQRYQISKQSN